MGEQSNRTDPLRWEPPFTTTNACQPSPPHVLLRYIHYKYFHTQFKSMPHLRVRFDSPKRPTLKMRAPRYTGVILYPSREIA